MKTTNFVLVALTLLSLTEASKGSGGGKKGGGKGSSTKKSDAAPTHRLLVMANDARERQRLLDEHRQMQEEINRERLGSIIDPGEEERGEVVVPRQVVPQQVVPRQEAPELEYHDSDSEISSVASEESLKSLSDNEHAAKTVIRKRIKKRRKRSSDYPKKRPAKKRAAVPEASSEGSSSSATGEVNEYAEFGVKPLKKLTDAQFAAAKIRNYAPYFDERNLSTEGLEFLKTCFIYSNNYNLAAFLINNGVRLPEEEEIILIIPTLRQPPHVLEEDRDELAVSRRILNEHLKADPLATIRLFIKSADATDRGEEQITDMFLFTLILRSDTSNSLAEHPDLYQTINLMISEPYLRESLSLIWTLKGVKERMLQRAVEERNVHLARYMFEHELLDLDAIFSQSVDAGDSIMAEFLVDVGLLNIHDAINQMFGNIDHRTILGIIKRHRVSFKEYKRILFDAYKAHDLLSFKGLLLMGAGYKHLQVPTKDGAKCEFKEYLKSKHSEYYKAIQSYEDGTLAYEFEEELAEWESIEMAQASGSSSSASCAGCSSAAHGSSSSSSRHGSSSSSSGHGSSSSSSGHGSSSDKA